MPQRDLENFKKHMGNMVSISSGSYETNDFTSIRANSITEYTRDEVLEIIAGGDPEELKELSTHYFYCSGFYRRFMVYYATF